MSIYRGRLWLGVLLMLIVGCGFSAESINIPIATPTPIPTATTGALPTLVPVATATATIVPTLAPVATSTPLLLTQTPSPAPENEFSERQRLMLTLINADRAANGLNPVAWDETLTAAGVQHADDLVAYSYFSHWGRDGLGPDHRYSQIGGLHSVMENLHLYTYTYDDGSGAPIENWDEVIHNAQTGLMNSPGHRVNILDPAHTHVGIGMAYNAATGHFAVAQEFGNQYVTLAQRLPTEAKLGSTVQIIGRIDAPNIDNVLLDLAYEPFPKPLTLEQLAQTSTYSSSAESVETIRIDPQFNEQKTLNVNDQSGIYHIRIFLDLNGEQSLVLDHSIWVQP